jgi:autotransporter family porin
LVAVVALLASVTVSCQGDLFTAGPDASNSDASGSDAAAPTTSDGAAVSSTTTPAPSPLPTAGDGSDPSSTPATDGPDAPPATDAPSPGSGGDTGRFEVLPPGSALPSGDECAQLVRPAEEVRADNTPYNTTPGTGNDDLYPRVDGAFTGTTDEVIQWAACKWGMDEDLLRAQVAKESWWHMSTGGDVTTDQEICHPDLRTGPGQECPESIGLMQVRYQYHQTAYEDSNAILSSAYNVDYALAFWRDCYEGDMDWLNTVERGAEYAAGDVEGCLGVWFSGRWRTAPAEEYIAAVLDYRDRRIWEESDFLNG